MIGFPLPPPTEGDDGGRSSSASSHGSSGDDKYLRGEKAYCSDYLYCPEDYHLIYDAYTMECYDFWCTTEQCCDFDGEFNVTIVVEKTALQLLCVEAIPSVFSQMVHGEIFIEAAAA